MATNDLCNRCARGASYLQKFGTAACLALMAWTAAAQGPNPLDSNNSIYPTPDEWSGGFRVANYAYPTNPVPSTWTPGADGGRINGSNALQYMLRVKQFVSAELSGIVNDPQHWSPAEAGWFDMMWSAQGSRRPDGSIDPNSGREALMGSYTGQILLPYTFDSPMPTVHFQNHAVIYYNDVAAAMLGRI